MNETSTRNAERPTLRSHLPFWCLAKNEKGQAIHLGRALREDEGDVCSEHAALKAEAVQNTRSAWKKFLDKPVFEGHGEIEKYTGPKFWPGADEPTLSQEAK